MQMPTSKGPDHIDDMMEWEKKQYTPGEYAQEGKLPPYLKAEWNKKSSAILFCVQGGICVFFIDYFEFLKSGGRLDGVAGVCGLCNFVFNYSNELFEKAENRKAYKREKKGS